MYKKKEKKPASLYARIGWGLLAIGGSAITFWYMYGHAMIVWGFDSWPVNQESIVYRLLAIWINLFGIGSIGFSLLLLYLGGQMILNRFMNRWQIGYFVGWIVVVMLGIGSIAYPSNSKLVGKLVYGLIWILEKNPLLVLIVLLVFFLTKKAVWEKNEQKEAQPIAQQREAVVSPCNCQRIEKTDRSPVYETTQTSLN